MAACGTEQVHRWVQAPRRPGTPLSRKARTRSSGDLAEQQAPAPGEHGGRPPRCALGDRPGRRSAAARSSGCCMRPRRGSGTGDSPSMPPSHVGRPPLLRGRGRRSGRRLAPRGRRLIGVVPAEAPTCCRRGFGEQAAPPSARRSGAGRVVDAQITAAPVEAGLDGVVRAVEPRDLHAGTADAVPVGDALR